MFDKNPPRDIENIPLETIDISNPFLFKQNKWQAYFQRLRNEAPVHYTANSCFGSFWSITLYEDIKFVNSRHDLFSSEGQLLIAQSSENNPTDLLFDAFITNDPPKHTTRRKAVEPLVSPKNLKEFEGLIRTRTQNLLDGLPLGEAFDWVKHVSIHLTSQMLAALVDYPLDQRNDLVVWSDNVLAGDKFSGGDVSSDKVHRCASELLETLPTFGKKRISVSTRGGLGL